VARCVHIKGRTNYDGDRPVRIAGVISDVTDRKLVDEQLRQARKMEAVGQLIGGFVSVDTEVGKATSILIHLPRTDPVDVAPEVLRAAAPEANGQGTILVVEDDPGVRATASALLRDLGYSVTGAETAHAALELINGGAPIALVFTNVIMPGGMNGIELANEIAQRRPDLAVLLTSGYTAQRLIPDSVTRVWTVLRKPYTLSDLSLAVSNAMERVGS
jgi:CheY-like chemotaxis protein